MSARNNCTVCVYVALPHAAVTGNFSQNSCCIHPLAHQLILTPLSRAFREKLTVSHLIRNSAFYGTRRFITVFTRPSQVYRFCARSIHSTTPNPVIRSILLLSSYLSLDFSKFPLFLRFSHKNPIVIFPFTRACHIPSPSHS